MKKLITMATALLLAGCVHFKTNEAKALEPEITPAVSACIAKVAQEQMKVNNVGAKVVPLREKKAELIIEKIQEYLLKINKNIVHAKIHAKMTAGQYFMAFNTSEYRGVHWLHVFRTEGDECKMTVLVYNRDKVFGLDN